MGQVIAILNFPCDRILGRDFFQNAKAQIYHETLCVNQMGR
jgi:hypothetical protein